MIHFFFFFLASTPDQAARFTDFDRCWFSKLFHRKADPKQKQCGGGGRLGRRDRWRPKRISVRANFRKLMSKPFKRFAASCKSSALAVHVFSIIKKKKNTEKPFVQNILSKFHGDKIYVKLPGKYIWCYLLYSHGLFSLSLPFIILSC